jgi:hypothetical protein
LIFSSNKFKKEFAVPMHMEGTAYLYKKQGGFYCHTDRTTESAAVKMGSLRDLRRYVKSERFRRIRQATPNDKILDEGGRGLTDLEWGCALGIMNSNLAQDFVQSLNLELAQTDRSDLSDRLSKTAAPLRSHYERLEGVRYRLPSKSFEIIEHYFEPRYLVDNDRVASRGLIGRIVDGVAEKAPYLAEHGFIFPSIPEGDVIRMSEADHPFSLVGYEFIKSRDLDEEPMPLKTKSNLIVSVPVLRERPGLVLVVGAKT